MCASSRICGRTGIECSSVRHTARERKKYCYPLISSNFLKAKDVDEEGNIQYLACYSGLQMMLAYESEVIIKLHSRLLYLFLGGIRFAYALRKIGSVSYMDLMDDGELLCLKGNNKKTIRLLF